MTHRLMAVLVFASLFLAACGGVSGTNPGSGSQPQQTSSSGY